MALQIASLNSGSNGNCYYVGNDREAVLIDAGISCRETVKRMKRIGLEPEKVKAIFISHEHSDHIRGVEVLSSKYGLPVYITPPTLGGCGLSLSDDRIKPFKAYSPVHVGELEVVPFPKLHDAADPHSFLISGNGVTVGVFTDIGSSCSHVIENFKRCDAAILESNYDDHMLETGSYPYYLKKRIRGDNGHLSNAQALELFRSYGERLNCLLLGHLSRDNNDPDLVAQLFAPHAGNTTVAVVSRYVETAVYTITANGIRPVQTHTAAVQMSLF